MRKKCDRELCACLFKLSAFATRHNAISPWDGGLVITCTGWALSRRDRLSEGCLSRGVLDINMWKISPFFFLLNQYKDIWPLNNVVSLAQKVFHPPSIQSCVLQPGRTGDADVLLTAISLTLSCTQCQLLLTPKKTSPRRPLRDAGTVFC